MEELWGLTKGDRVEFRRRRPDPWEMGVVYGFTTDRNMVVRPEEGGPPTVIVRLPSEVRKWHPPTNVEDIDKFLNGG